MEAAGKEVERVGARVVGMVAAARVAVKGVERVVATAVAQAGEAKVVVEMGAARPRHTFRRPWLRTSHNWMRRRTCNPQSRTHTWRR